DGAVHLNIVGQLKAELEGPLGNAAVEEFTGLVGGLGRFGALDYKVVFLGLDGDVAIGKTSHCNRDAVGVITCALDIVGRVGLGFLPDQIVEAVEDPVKADRGAIEGGKIDGLHSHILRKATWIPGGLA